MGKNGNCEQQSLELSYLEKQQKITCYNRGKRRSTSSFIMLKVNVIWHVSVDQDLNKGSRVYL